jgi:carboxyl-terminal processing protease
VLALAPRSARALEEAATAGSAPAVAESLLRRAETQDGPDFWITVRKLPGLGEGAVPVLVEGLTSRVERRRLAAAKALLELGDEENQRRAGRALEDLASEGESRDVRVAAMDLLASYGDPEEALEVLERVLDRSLDPALTIPAARALWDLDRLPRARETLVELLGSKDLAVKRRAAIALAEIDYYEGDVRDVLREMRDEPSEAGRHAESLYRKIQLSRMLDADPAAALEGTDMQKLLEIKEERIRLLEKDLERAKASRPGAASGALDAVLNEVILQVTRSYVDPAKTERKNLIISAIKGLVGDLDEFSSFMDPEETRAFAQSISGEYFGIGAQVHKTQDGPLEILRPIYGGPAYKAGLLSGDQILEVDGAAVLDVPMQEIVERLKGPAASKVSLKVIRRGWPEPREFVIERKMVEIPSVYSDLLPGGIAYLLLQQFGEKSADEFIAALDALEKRGMEGLVVDLRNDPGGRLDVAVRIVDQFVAGDLPIVTQKGRGEGEFSQEYRTVPDPFKRENYPMVVLVNERSASASEIMAGALQDHGRATIVGKRTYGKGSVQRLIPLSTAAAEALGGESELRLTVQYYFLPLGRCVHTIRDERGAVAQQGGVAPDVEVDAETIPVWRFEERERLRTHPRVLQYVEEHAAELERLFVEGDGRDAGRYPEIDAVKEAVSSPSPLDDLRVVVRNHVRRRIEDSRGREFPCDVQEDVQLQGAILEVLRKLQKRPEDFPAYAGIGKRS